MYATKSRYMLLNTFKLKQLQIIETLKMLKSYFNDSII